MVRQGNSIPKLLMEHLLMFFFLVIKTYYQVGRKKIINARHQFCLCQRRVSFVRAGKKYFREWINSIALLTYETYSHCQPDNCTLWACRNAIFKTKGFIACVKK